MRMVISLDTLFGIFNYTELYGFSEFPPENPDQCKIDHEHKQGCNGCNTILEPYSMKKEEDDQQKKNR